MAVPTAFDGTSPRDWVSAAVEHRQRGSELSSSSSGRDGRHDAVGDAAHRRGAVSRDWWYAHNALCVGTQTPTVLLGSRGSIQHGGCAPGLRRHQDGGGRRDGRDDGKNEGVLRLSGDAHASSLTRAVPIRTCLPAKRGCVRHIKGTAKDYELSAPTKQYDYFLSHSWRASRWHKLWLLLLFFRGKAVLVGSLSGTVLGFVLT